MNAFLVVALVLGVVALLIWLYTFTLNGKGPGAGFRGMWLLSKIKWILIIAAISAAVWFGSLLQSVL